MDRERATPPTVRISFEGAHDDLSPMVTVYNPQVLSFACLTQVNRFGLTGDRKEQIAGRLKGTRKSLLEVIRTYGNNIEITRAETSKRIG
jgi:hypothetical protein